MVHLDQIAQILTPKGLKVIGLLDSPLYLDLDTINKTGLGLNQQMALAYENFNVNGIVPKECLSENEGHEWRCIFGQYRLPFIQTPFVLYADQYDLY